MHMDDPRFDHPMAKALCEAGRAGDIPDMRRMLDITSDV